MSSPWQAIDDFEAALCRYTGAPYAVALSSCSAALTLCCEWHFDQDQGTAGLVVIPKRTYISVPLAIMHAGGYVEFHDDEWSGVYQLNPYPIWDCALRFTSGMFQADQMQCVSFAAAKILGLEQGGAILHDNQDADLWFRQMRFDGRTPGMEVADDEIVVCGYHFPMLPSTAAALTLRLHHLPRHNADQVREYPDISTKRIFK